MKSVALAVVLVVCIIAGFSWFIYYRQTAPCSDFAWASIGSVPARCYEELFGDN